jgi:DNA-directed RNA polymerase II subunit RPB2
MDCEESNNALIAMKYKDLAKGTKGHSEAMRYTHLEIHPSLILGVLASNIPFPDHNQAPRNTYQASMGKQAIGVYASNYMDRYDTLGHVLNYSQVPLVRTRVSDIMPCNKLPCGMNVIVAIMTYTGFNQEDSVMINKSAVDRGLFNSTYYRTFKEICNKNHSTGEEEVFCIPSKKKNLKLFKYDKIGADGFVEENTKVEQHDIIIGKCMPTKNLHNNTIANTNPSPNHFDYKDNSISLKGTEPTYIDRVCANDRYFKNSNGDGYTFCKVRTRAMRQPVIGDKLSSRHGQKGTIGMVYNQEDMPYTADGLVPDVIINPHAIPSRMTIGQLMEGIFGKACVSLGSSFGDATPFTGLSVADISQVLEERSIEKHGNEIMYNSRTGEQIHTDVFITPTYYQRLKHMTIDKIHSRGSNGPVVLLTRQPAEGRAREGGLRIGEMETEVIQAYSAFTFLKERFMECSDNYRLFVCKLCGMVAIFNQEKNIWLCKTCKNNLHFSQIRLPYACKLLFQEIQAMSIGVRFNTINSGRARGKITI